MTFGSAWIRPRPSESWIQAFDAGSTFSIQPYLCRRALRRDARRNIGGPSESVVIATKFTNPTGPGPNDSGMSRVHIMNVIRIACAACGRLIRCYYIHHLDTLTPMEERCARWRSCSSGQGALHCVQQLSCLEVVRALWISEVTSWRALYAAAAIQPSRARHRARDSAVMRAQSVGIVPWAPLASGFLTGKYQPGSARCPAHGRAKDGCSSALFAPNAIDV
jgi:aryl-alcohol dehydrogenase-like predicted oxidoreductase